MIESWEQLAVALGRGEPIPPVAIRSRRYTNLCTLFGSNEPAESHDFLRDPAVRKEIGALFEAVRDGKPASSVLGSIALEDEQSIGSIAAATDLDVEIVDASVCALTTAGLVRVNEIDGVERVSIATVGS